MTPKLKKRADKAAEDSLRFLTFRQMVNVVFWRYFAKHKAQYYIVRLLQGYSVHKAYKFASTVTKREWAGMESAFNDQLNDMQNLESL